MGLEGGDPELGPFTLQGDTATWEFLNIDMGHRS